MSLGFSYRIDDADRESFFMSHARPQQYFASTQRAVANADAIDAAFMASPAEILHESMAGVVIRELDEPELFRHFFGSDVIGC